MDTQLAQLSITPRHPAARMDLDAAQDDILALLREIAGVQWRFNDRAAQAVIVDLPAGDVARARTILEAVYMVDINPGLQHF